MIKERNVLQEEASKTGDNILVREAKIKAVEVKKDVENDKKAGMMTDLGDYTSNKVAWRTARNVLGIVKNLSPTAIKDDNGELIKKQLRLLTISTNSF